MMHLPLAPMVLPLLLAIVLLLPPVNHSLRLQRGFVLLGALGLMLFSALALKTANHGEAHHYALGSWQAPFGIALVLDGLSALMVALTSVLLFAVLLYAQGGDDAKGQYFYPLMLFLVMGVNGAFLTGDVFNLFVFFEVLLIASYALVIHGGGKQRTQAGMHYVILNLIASSFFIVALGLFYGVFGSLNLEHMATKVPQLAPDDRLLVKVGGLLLLLVFGLKAAVLPLQFWLPRTYEASAASVAALFAIMTKVGVYSLLRVHQTLFGAQSGELSHFIGPWLWPLALLTVLVGIVGVLASPGLRQLAAHLVIVSVGSLLLALAINTAAAASAAVYYLIHSTLVAAALFLLADAMAQERGTTIDRFVAGRPLQHPRLWSMAFFVAAISVIGMPPLSGFVGKLLLLQAAHRPHMALWVWPALLLSSLAVLVAMSRAGTSLLWRVQGEALAEVQPGVAVKAAAIFFLLLFSVVLAVLAGPLTSYTLSAVEPLFTASIAK